MKKLLLFVCAMFFMVSMFGQSSANYAFSTITTGSLEDMSTGTTQLVGAGSDDTPSNITNIGFPFIYMGNAYTTFSVSSNGFLQFGNTQIVNTLYVLGGANVPLIAPFGDDLETGATGKVHYKLIGTSPNQRLVVEWLNMGINYNSTTIDGTFQLVLYEGTGVIDFIYGAMAVGAAGSTGPYYVGFSKNSTDNTYATVSTATNIANTTGGLVTNTYVAGVVIPNLNSVADGSRRVYTFTPPAAIPNAPSLLNFTSVTATGMTLNWTDNSSDETGFAIFRSNDGGVTYNPVATLPAGTVTYPATGLSPSTNYFWRVYAVNEGRASTALSGNQATTPPPPPLVGIKNIPSANYPNFVAAFDSIANMGIGTGGVIFQVAAGYTETATNLVLTNSTLYPPTALNTILFQKNGVGANPVISRTDAGSLFTSTLGGQGDAVIIIQGADYVTFDGIDVSASDMGIEYGYYLRKASATDGCRNVTIKNANITMTKGTSSYVAGIYSSNNDASSLVSSATGITLTSQTGRNENITITGNTIGNVFAGIILRGFASAAPYNFYDQNMVVGASGAGNTIQNFAGNTASTSYGVYLIYQNMANISYNTLNNMTGGGTAATTLLYGIFNSTGTNSTFTAIWNNINLTQSGAAGALYGINTASTGNLTLENNNVTLSTTAATSGAFGYLYNSSAANSTSVSISNNTFTGATLNVTGTTYLIYNNSTQLAPGLTTIQNNVISGTINRTGASGTFYCYYNNGSPTGTENINGNTFSNITLAGTSVFYGINSTTAAAHTSNVFQNTISNITGGSGTMYGTNLTTANYRSVIGNTIHSFSGGGTIYGISISSGFPGNVYRNQVYNLSSSPAGALVYGIYTGGGTTLNIFNNLISDLKAPAATGTIAIAGIYASSGTYINIFYNTIYLNATSSSVSTFGNAGIYASTTPIVDLRNNIVVNTSGNIGATGYTVAYRRSSTTISTYATTSNNNDFYAGAPGPKNLVFFDGTNADQTLAAFRSRVAPADGQSISVIPPFINIVTTPYDLKIQTSVATAIESGGIIVTSPIAITTDFQFETRYPDPGTPANVGFPPKAPDIGADEFGGLNSDIVAPKIVYTPLGNTGSTAPRTLIATITDVTGVSNTPTGLPVLYWKVNAGGYTAVTATALPSNQYSFTFGGGIVADVFSYYIVAQDLVAPPNVGATPWAGVTGYTADPPTCTPAPTNPSTYTITSSLSGTKTVGVGGDFLTLTGAGGAFATINAGALSGNLILSIIGNLTEDGTNALNQWVEDGAGNYTLTIQPDGTTERVISGAVALSGMIRLNGADRLAIDGRSGGSGKYLRFRNTNTANPVFTFLNDATNNTIRNCYIESPSTASTGLLNFSTTTASTGNNNNLITDNVFRDRSDATGVPTYMIYSSGTVAKDNAFNTISNNEFANFTTYGIFITTGSAGNWTISGNSFYNNLATPPSASQYPIYFSPGTLSPNNLISGNFIGGQSANCGGAAWVNTGASTFYGIYLLAGLHTTSIQGNTIQNLSFTSTSTPTFRGIYAVGGTLNIGTVTGNLIGSLTVPGSITVSGTTSPYGIYANTNLNCANNTFANIAINNTTAAPNCMAIYMTGNFNMNVYNNRIVNLGPTSAAANGTNNYPTAGIMLSGAPVPPNTYNVYNNLISLGNDGYTHDIAFLGIWFNNSAGIANIYFNSINLGGTEAPLSTRGSVAFQKQGIAIVDVRDNIFTNYRLNGAAGTALNLAYYAVDVTNITSDNNDLFTPDPTAIAAWGGFYYNFAGYQAASGKDANSVSVDPLFASYTDLRTCKSELNGTGIAIPGITTDYAGVTRGTPPDIGAYEFTIPSPTIAGLASVCEGTTGVIYSTEAGMSSYTWVVSAGGIITAGPGTNQVTITWNTFGPQTISVNYANANGCFASTPTVYNVTVNPNATIALTSLPGTDAQSVCINTPITNITYAVGGGGTGAGVTGLPTGVTGSYVAGVFTITGTPSVIGTFNYTITTTGTCTQTTALGTITVNPDATIALTSGAGTDVQSLCINTPITNITYAIGGGGTGAGVTGLPTGITGAYAAGVFTISGSPSVTGTYNYIVITTGTCVQTSANGTITVNPDATIILTSVAGTDAQSLCVNTPITNITYSIAGGGTGAGVTGLPAGVTGTYLAGVFTITGTPSVFGTFNYTVTTTGTCLQVSAIGTITVNPDATIALTSAGGTDAQSLCVNTPITNITYSIGGGGTGAGVTGLPTGITGDYAAGVFTISGSPSVIGTYNYTVTTTGTCVQTSGIGSITVNPDATIALTSAAGTDAQSLCINTPITDITYAIGGGGTGAGVAGLPAGVTGTFAAGVFTISGSPSVTGIYNYTVTTTGTCVQTSAIGTITVNPDATIILTSVAGTDAQSLCINTPITDITYAIGGGGGGAGVTGLPTGVTGSYAAGVFTISGSPSVTGIYNYTVTTTGTCVQTSAIGTITVNPDATIILTSAAGTDAQSLCINTPITNITYAIGGGGGGAGVTGLPTGVTGGFAAGVFTISGTPSVLGIFNYTVTTTGTCLQVTALGTITVNPDATITLTSAAGTDVQTVCINTPITNITYAIGGGGTSAGVTGLPTGVTGTFAAGVFTISGSPSVVGSFNYTITTTGTCVQTTATGTINVDPISVGGSIAGSATVCAGTNSTLLTLSGYTGNIVKWQYSTDNWATSTDIANTLNTYTATNLMVTTKFQAVIQSGVCAAVNSLDATVTVNPQPVPVINGPANVIVGTSGHIYITDVGMTGYFWAISPGNSIDAGQGTNTISVTWNTPGLQWVSVTYTDGNSCNPATPTIFNVNVLGIPGPAGPITGVTPVCQGQMGVPYSVAPILNATGYVWTLPTGASVATGNNTNSITVDFSATAVSGNITVYGTNAFGVGATSPPFAVTVNPAPVPSLTGAATACFGTIKTYTTDAGFTNYTWAVTGGTITGGGNGFNFVSVNWNVGVAPYIGSVSVNYTNAIGCPGAVPTVLNVTVNPLPVPTLSGPASMCINTAGNTYITEAGQDNYVWTVSPGGLVTAGGTSIHSFVTVTWNTAGPQSITVNYMNGFNCFAVNSTVFPVTVIANVGVPVFVLGPASTRCQGAGTVTYTATATDNTSLTYTLDAVSLGAGNTIDVLTGAVTYVAGWTGTSTITATATGCGPTQISIHAATTYPTPFVNPVSNVAYCNGATTLPIPLTGTPGGATFAWTNSDPTIGLAASGSGNIPSFTATNLGVVPVIALITVTPTANGCFGIPMTFTITVNPTPNAVATPAAQTVCSANPITTIVLTGSVAGTTYSWTRDNNATVTGIAASGAGDISGTLTNTTFAPVLVTFTITPTANSCPGAPITATVLVNPTPDATATPASQTICSANPITTIVLTGSVAGTTYNWTRDNNATVTGIAASGAGDISGTLTNTTFAPVTVTFTITPTANGCPGTPIIATVLVNPTPDALATPAAQTVCSAIPITTIVLSGSVAGTTYNWTRDNNATVTGIAASGTGNISGTLTNTTFAPITVTFTITPSANGCTGTPITATVLVNPTPNATATPASQTICSANPITTIVMTGSVAGTTYNWTRDNVATVTGIAASGSGNISGTLTNTTFAPVTVTFTITPTANGCPGAPITATVLVNPTPNAVATPAAQTICSANPITTIVLTGNVAGTTFIWTRDNTVAVTGIAASGSGNISGTLTNTTFAPVTVTFTITPSANGCTGTPILATVLVNPTPTANAVSNVAYCAGNTTAPINFTGPVAGTTYAWTNSNPAIGLGASGTGNIPSFVATNPGAVPIVGTIIVTPSANGCTGPVMSFTITVNPLPVPTITGPATACAPQAGNVYTTQAGMTGYIWTVSAGGTITAGAGTNTITVTWNTVGTQTVCVNYTNSYGCTASAPTCYTVTVNPRPIPVISGPSVVCAGSTGNVYSTLAGMTGYTWVVTGGTITGGSGTNSITVTWTTPGAQTVTLNYTNTFGCPATTPTVYPVTVNPLPVPTIAGPTPVCINSTGNVYTTQAGMTGYVWTVTGGTFTGGGTNAITVTWTTAGAQSVSVVYTNANGCTNTTPAVFNVTVNPAPVPTITGYTSMCIDVTPLLYTTEAGMTNYVWTVSPGNTITSGQGTNQAWIAWTSGGAQWVAVTYTNASGCAAAAPTQLNVFVNPLPDPAGTITGTAAVCGGTNGVAYSIGTIANATSYVWLLPPGATIATGAGTNSITVVFDPFASSGDIIAYGNNTCGNGAFSPPFAVTVTPLPDTAGVITGPAAVCQGVSGVVYTVPVIANATGYVWTVPAGATIVAGANTNSITVDFSLSAVSGMITVYGTNSCGNGAVGPEFAVTVNPIPPTPIITVINDIILHSNVPTGNQWYFQGTAIPGATGQDYTADQSGEYWCVVTWNGCSSDTSNHIWIVMPGIQPQPVSSNFVVYPVPNDGQFKVTITYPTLETFNIKVYNNLGVMIHEIRNVEVNGTTERSIDLRPTSSGIYSVIFENGSNRVIRKILINR